MVMSSPKRSASVPLSPWKQAAAAAVVLLMVGAVVAPAQAPERFMTVRLEVVAADEGTSRPAEAVTALLDCPNIEVHLDQMFLKPPKVGRGTLHHQDNGALPAPRFVSHLQLLTAALRRLLPDRGPAQGHGHVDRRR